MATGKIDGLFALSHIAESGTRSNDPCCAIRAAATLAGSAPAQATPTARHCFNSVEAFEQLCIRARDRAEAGRSEFDRQLAAEARFKQLRHGLDAPLRPSELRQLCRIAGVDVPEQATALLQSSQIGVQS